MKKIKLEFIHEGFEAILCSSEAGNLCSEQAEKIKDRANSELTSENSAGFQTGGKITTAYGSKRWMYFVNTTDSATMYAEKNDQVLSKAVSQ